MKKLFALFLLFTATVTLHAQTSGPNNNDVVFTIAQHMPRFNGDMSKYISDNIKYPEAERKAGLSGTVYVTFVVEKDGSVTGVRVLRGVPKAPGLDAEALRVIKSMPAWTPGMQEGKKVRVQFNVPIKFELK